MAIVRLKGLNRVRTKLASGREAVYWYAWKGGPRLPGRPGSPEFIAAFNAAVASRQRRPEADLGALVSRYRASPQFEKLSEATRKEWSRWLDRIQSHTISSLPYGALDDHGVRDELFAWREQWADRPRSADYAVQVLARVLSWGVKRGILRTNAMAGAEPLYSTDRADQIWTADEIERFCAKASREVGFALRLACLTGLRRSDLVKLTWGHVTDSAIAKPTSKSRGKQEAVIPILPETRALLAEIKAQRPAAVTVLANTRGKSWTPDGLETQVIKTKAACGIDKHLHDARGTFATRCSVAGVQPGEVASIMGWKEGRVQALLSRYVEREAVVRALVRRITRNESRGRAPK